MSVAHVVLKPRRARPFFGRHPWVFAGAIHHLEIDGNNVADIPTGQTVDLVTDKGEFVARGLYNGASNIRVRLYTWDADTELNHDFWDARLADAIELRQQFFLSSETSACRLVFSEGDGISGLTVDQYGDWLLVQFTSAALHVHAESLISILQSRIQPQGIWLRTEKGMLENEQLELADGLISGVEPPRPLFITEQGTQFGVDVHEGQKTGFFLDQSANRQMIAQLATNKRVLDLFCYTGGFSITCGRHGAKMTLGIDSSATAIAAAQANAELNGVGSICQFEKSDVKAALKRLNTESQKFDMVIVDPPKMARRRNGLEKALKGYMRVNREALMLLEPGGLLVTCSCSGLVSRDNFEDMLSALAQQTRRGIQIIETRGGSMDHPVAATCPESAYLKCYVCRVL